jgi:hypothetical protein
MDKTDEEIAASKIELWTSCSWRRFHFAGPRGGPFAEPIIQRSDNHPDIWFAGGEETGHRMAACWNACAGMVDPETEVAAARAEGFRAGAEAMREAVEREIGKHIIVGVGDDPQARPSEATMTARRICDRIRSLPIPEMTDDR